MKYNIGDEVWLIRNDQVESFEITKRAEDWKGRYYTGYVENIKSMHGFGWVSENNVFSSREDLIKSLI